MQIFVNGDPREVTDALPLSALIAELELTGRRIAVEVNRELVPRGRFDGHTLTPGDQVEIIHAVGGG